MAEARAAGEPASVTRSLFAFPAEDNFAGVKYPLRWIKEVQAMSTEKHEWKVLLDAAAFVPTQPLDLTEYPADFAAISFYKIFGYPTGLGALIIKTDMVDQLRKVFWGGGSVSLATSNDNFHMLKCKPSEKLEDGTIAFLDIINLRHGFELIERLGGIEAVQRHVRCLTKYLFQRLTSIRHSNGRSVVKVFGKHRARNAADVQGGIVNFEIMQPDGNVFSYKTVEREAASAGFHIRTGAECNPGACYRYVGLEEAELEQLAGEKEGCDDDVEFLEVQRPEGELSPFHSISGDDIMDMLKGSKVELGHQAEVAMKWLRVPLGSVRVSLGYMSTFEDVEAFANFVEKTYRNRAVA